jgi:F-type H+-transporting ATPase subunit b
MGDLIHKLGIEWKLLLAQIVNFVILFLVLKKFLYRPLINLMNRRREKIIDGLEKARRGEEEFAKIAELKERELAKIQKEAEGLIQKAKEIGDKKQQEILKEAEEKTKKIVEEARGRIEIEKEKMLTEVRQDIVGLVINATEKILKEKIDAEKEKKLINEAIGKLNEV